MSNTIDISATSTKTDGQKPDKAKGAMSRFLFTLAIATAICLAIVSFLWILGRTTGEPSIALNVEQRSAEQIYASALEIPEKPLRLRALRNYISAYPEQAAQTQTDTLIETLETDEYEKWLALSDVFYSATARQSAKLEAVEGFAGEWGAGTYVTELSGMRAQLDAAPAQSAERPAPPAPQAEPAPIEDTTDMSEFMAGGPPTIEIYQPATLLPTIIEPVIIAATIDDDVQPSYPSRARSRGIEAVVTIAMDIGADGKVKDAYIVKAATGRYANDFGNAAVRAAKKTRFTPKTIDGEPSPTNGFTRRYRFEMDG